MLECRWFIMRIPVYAFLFTMLLTASSTFAKLAITWGRRGTGSLVPSMVVDMLLQNGITEAKVYNINDDVIKAFSGTGIELTIVIPKPETISSPDLAMEYVNSKIVAFPDVNIKYVLVGNNAFGIARLLKTPYSTIVNALRLVQNAIDLVGYRGRVKAILTHSLSGVLTVNSTRVPSEATFSDGVMDAMLDVLRILNETNAPFMYDIFPIGILDIYNYDIEYAFCDNNSTYGFTDTNGIRYTNAFDHTYDCFVWALIKAGFPNIKVGVSQIGWPTDGHRHANVRNAERFWKSLLPVATSKRGTPMRPGEDIDIYLHSLADEKKNPPVPAMGRHWGIYWSNGEPKYKLDLTGQGRDVYPTKVMGINLMPPRWCVFTGNNLDHRLVQEQYDYACLNADCTSLVPGGSCGGLQHDDAISYAFNAYFQTNFQDEKACTFNGLAKLSSKNPSIDTCVFIVEVVRGNKQANSTTKWG